MLGELVSMWYVVRETGGGGVKASLGLNADTSEGNLCAGWISGSARTRLSLIDLTLIGYENKPYCLYCSLSNRRTAAAQ